MTDETKSSLKKWGLRALMTLIPIILGAIGGTQFTTPKTVEVERKIEVPVPVPQLDEFEPSRMGWLRDDETIRANLDPAKTLHFVTTPAGRAALGDEDVFLYRVVRSVNSRGSDWYPNVNQQSVGCCVGCGFKHGCDVVQATAIAAGAGFEWKAAAVEAIYAGSRVEVGRGQIRGDGSMGAWASEWLKSRGGLIPMEKLGKYDLTTFSPARARQWGTSGVPDELEADAKKHAVKGAALVTTSTDVKRSLMQGYPVAVCSTVGFNNRDGSVGTRDAQGFIGPRGTWPHCMCFIGWRNGSRPGALCLNSWGDQAHGGPVWPEDAPLAAFWVDASVVDRMVSQGDSFALADVAGFPARTPDWFIHAEPKREVVARPERAEFALHP